jgi:sugar lactone lactonase YvrE
MGASDLPSQFRPLISLVSRGEVPSPPAELSAGAIGLAFSVGSLLSQTDPSSACLLTGSPVFGGNSMRSKCLVAPFACVFLLSSIVLAFSGCGSKSNTSISTTSSLPAAVVSSFTSSAASISAGDSVTLSWTAAYASSISIDNGVGTVTGTSVQVKPTKTTTYNITATNPTGSSTKSVTVTVVALPTIASFAADNTLLSPATTGPSSATLSWNVTGATTLSLDNSIGTVTGTSQSVSPAATTTYTLTAANSIGGTATATVTVKVRSNLAVLAGTSYAGTDRASYLYSISICGYPFFIATDAAGNIYSTDRDSDAVCKITPTGNVTILASNAGSYYYYDAIRSTPHAASAHAGLSSAASTKPVATGIVPSHTPLSASYNTSKAAAGSLVNAGIYYPTGIAVTPDGSTVYVSDSDTSSIRKISIASDGTTTISLVAGGQSGYVDGPGTSARFNYPRGLAIDASGNLYVADSDNYVIRKITFASDGTATVSTLAGNGTYGYVDDVASKAEFGYIDGLAVSADGLSLYVTDDVQVTNPATSTPVNMSPIRKVATAPDASVTVSTIAGAQYGYLDGTGTSAQFSQVEQIALSADGSTLYAADPGNSLIRKIVMTANAPATVTTLAGTLGTFLHWDGPLASSWFEGPSGIALDTTGNLYVTDTWSDYSGIYGYGNGSMTLRKITPAGQVSSLVLNVFDNTGGSADGVGAKAAFNVPGGIASDAKGNYYVTDVVDGAIRKIAMASDGTANVTNIAGTPSVYGYIDGNGPAAQFNQPYGLAVDAAGDTLYIADSANATVRALDLTSGAVTTVAGTAGKRGYQQGSGTNSMLYYPRRLAIDSTGLIYVVDQAIEGSLRTIDPGTGNVSTIVLEDGTNGTLYSSVPMAAIVYTSADKTKSYLYIAARCAVFQVDLTATTPKATLTAGSSICGYQDGAAASALFSDIWDIAADSQGNLYVADAENSVIRRISTDGKVSTVVGAYGSTLNTMGALPGSLYLPLGIAVDASDNLLITTPNAILTLVP